MKYKTPETRARYLNIAIGLFLAALLILFAAGMWTDTGAIPKATPTPANQNHCMMLDDGICYIIYPANCVLGTPEIYGPESAGVPVECE